MSTKTSEARRKLKAIMRIEHSLARKQSQYSYLKETITNYLQEPLIRWLVYRSSNESQDIKNSTRTVV